MASDGTRVFILGGISSLGAQVDEITITHVFDTSTYLLFVISFEQPPSLKTQSTSRTRNPTPPLSILVRGLSPKNWAALLLCRLLLKVRPSTM
jgi:hypothetical protein